MRRETMKLLKSLVGTSEGAALLDWLEEKRKELNSTLTIKGTLQEKGRIVEARQEAIKILDNLFSFLQIEKEKPKKKTSYV